MIRHIVLMRFSAGTDAGERAGVLAGLAASPSTVPGVLSFTGGPNVGREDHSAGFTHAFTMDFPDKASRDAYLAHPARVVAAFRLSRAADSDAGIVVVDLFVSP